MAEVPLKLPTGKITGRLVVEVQDDHDVDQDPEIIPANGMIMVKSSIDHLQIYSETEGKFITFRGPHRAILDDEGYICTPYPGTDEVMYRGLVLWANDSDQLSVKGWTYSMTFSLKAPDGRQLSLPMTTFTLATGQERDIADIVSVPSTPGYGLPQAENSAALAAASALESKQSAEEAQALAQSVRDDADAGAFDGLSTYQIWLGLGNTGTETDFINWLKGSTNQTGDIYLDGLLLTGVTARTITVSRQNDLVTLSVRGLTVATSGSQNIFTSFPVGFRPANTQELRVPIAVGAGSIVRLIQVNGPNTWYSGANTADLLSFQVTFRTNDSWPIVTTPNSLAFRTGYTGAATVRKLNNSYVLFEMTALDTTQGVAGQSPFAVPVEYRPAPNGQKFTCEWTDGTSNQYDISTTTGHFYPPVGKVLKTPVKFMWPATP